MSKNENTSKFSFPSYGMKTSYSIRPIRIQEGKDERRKIVQEEGATDTLRDENKLLINKSERDPEVWFKAGNAFIEKKEYRKGIESYTQALALKPNHLHSAYNRAGAYLALDFLEDALSDYQKAGEIDPHLALAKYNAGVVLQKMGMHSKALDCFLHALAIEPNHLEALYNAGSALLQGKRYIEALKYFDKAIQINSSVAEIHNNRATALRKIGDKFNALKGYRKALAINPNHGDACSNFGISLADFNQPVEAAEVLMKAVRLGVRSASVWHTLGMCQSENGKKNDALISLQKARELDSNHDGLLSDLLHIKMKACDWKGLHDLRIEIIDQVDSGIALANPFSFITNFDDLSRQRKVAERYVATLYGATDAQNISPYLNDRKKLEWAIIRPISRSTPLCILLLRCWKRIHTQISNGSLLILDPPRKMKCNPVCGRR